MKRLALVFALALPLAAQQMAAPTLQRKFINASGAAVNVKSSAGALYGFCLTNETATTEYAEFFNSASTPTLGTTAVDHAIKIAGSATVCPGPSHVGTGFGSGLGFASVTTENGSTTALMTGVIYYE